MIIVDEKDYKVDATWFCRLAETGAAVDSLEVTVFFRGVGSPGWTSQTARLLGGAAEKVVGVIVEKGKR